jgi:hypothetical protein
MRFAEAEAWIDQHHKGYLDNTAVSILSKIDLGRDLRIFWSLELEDSLTHDLAVRVLAEYSKPYPDFSYLGIVELGRRRPQDRYLLQKVQDIFEGVRPIEDTPCDEIEYWKDIVLSSPGWPTMRALVQAFRFYRSASARPAVRKTLDDEIHLWYMIATQIKTSKDKFTAGWIMQKLKDALLENVDVADATDEFNQTWIWMEARDRWTWLKNRAWDHPIVTDQIQGYLDDACEMLHLLQSEEQLEILTAVVQLGNFLLSFF